MTSSIKNVAVTIGACVTIFTGLWFFASPAFHAHVEDIIQEYVESENHKLKERKLIEKVSKEVIVGFIASGEFESRIDEYLDRVNTNSVSLRKLLSIKMGVPQESVADKISDLYTKDSKRLRNLLRGVNIMYPELNVWEIPEN